MFLPCPQFPLFFKETHCIFPSKFSKRHNDRKLSLSPLLVENLHRQSHHFTVKLMFMSWLVLSKFLAFLMSFQNGWINREKFQNCIVLFSM